MNADLSNEQNKAAPVMLKPSDTQTHRVSTSLNVVCTVPLRSVSVAWTNRISPDPARTSGPSSFWGKIRTVSEMRRIKWKLMPDRKMERDGWDQRREIEEKSGQSWYGVMQSGPKCSLHLPFICLFFFPSLKGPHLSLSCTSSSDDEEKVRLVCDKSPATAICLLKQL